MAKKGKIGTKKDANTTQKRLKPLQKASKGFKTPKKVRKSPFITRLKQDLEDHLKKNSGAPTDEFMVSAVVIQLNHYFDLAKKMDKKNKPTVKDLKQFNDQFLLVLGLFRDLGALPKQFVDLKRKVQITGSNDKETKEINTEAYTADISPITL